MARSLSPAGPRVNGRGRPGGYPSGRPPSRAPATPRPRRSAVPARLVVLASGAGTTLQAVLDACGDPDYGAEVVAVGSDRRDAYALERAAAAGVPTFVVAVDEHPTRGLWDDAVEDALAAWQPDLVVCAGFMRVLGPAVVRRFPLVNTHPSLLPAFPGAHAVRDALAYGVHVTGVTVHVLDEGLDTGPVLAQAPVPVEPGDDEDALRERIQAVERPLYVTTIGRLVREGLPASTRRAAP